jgi:hypothetical protein
MAVAVRQNGYRHRLLRSADAEPPSRASEEWRRLQAAADVESPIKVAAIRQHGRQHRRLGVAHAEPPSDAGEAQDPVEFNVNIDNTVGQMLGVDIHVADGVTLQIGAVTDGLVQQWNDNHPELAVKPGDHIVEANGIRNDAGHLVNECSQHKMLELVVQRGQEERSDLWWLAHGAAPPSKCARLTLGIFILLFGMAGCLSWTLAAAASDPSSAVRHDVPSEAEAVGSGGSSDVTLARLKVVQPRRVEVPMDVGGAPSRQVEVPMAVGGAQPRQAEVPVIVGGAQPRQAEVPVTVGGAQPRQVEVPVAVGGAQPRQVEVPVTVGGAHRDISMIVGGREDAGTARLASSTTTQSITIPPKTTTTTTNVATIATTIIATDTAPSTSCDQLCNWDTKVPTVVITLSEEDLCAMEITANSISKQDRLRRLGKVILVWVSQSPPDEYSERMSKILDVLNSRGEVELLNTRLPEGGSEWRAQQAVRLKAASVVQSDFYIVLHARDAIFRDVSELFFTDCSQGKVFGRYSMYEMPQPERDSYDNAASLLGVKPLHEGKWPALAAPLVMHTSTVLGLLRKLGEPSGLGDCAGGLCDALAAGTSELTLYMVYAMRSAAFDCMHSVEERAWNDDVASVIWAPPDEESQRAVAKHVRAVAEGSEDSGRPAFLGVRAGGLLAFAGEPRRLVLADLARLYGHAGLNRFDTAEDLAACLDPGDPGPGEDDMTTSRADGARVGD